MDDIPNDKVGYVYSPAYAKLCDAHEKCKGRASLVHNLIKSYGLFKHMNVVDTVLARESDLGEFHSGEYLDVLAGGPRSGAAAEADEEELGFGWDCPLLETTWTYARATAGGTLRLAEALRQGQLDVGINWGGGWHHAFPDAAAGFCFVNDCVLAILNLRKTFNRVLYLDLDVHHGDGVQEAFRASSKVVTLSIHHQSPGFFPGSGGASEVGSGCGRHATLNVPLGEGATDAQFIRIVERLVGRLWKAWEPEAVVVQCGVDGLAKDPINAWNLSTAAYVGAIKFVRSLGVPLLVLGGGGYDGAATAKAWTAVTRALLSPSLPPLDDDIPSECADFVAFGPDYSLRLRPGRLRNYNDDTELDLLLTQLEGNIDVFAARQ